jgi:hypothetical protein
MIARAQARGERHGGGERRGRDAAPRGQAA